MVVSSTAIVIAVSDRRRRLIAALGGDLQPARDVADVAVDANRVEEAVVLDPHPHLLQARGESARAPADALGDRAQPFRAVIDGVHPGDHGQQHLRRADVARRLLAPDVLLARLQRHPVRDVAVPILGDADETPRQLAHPFAARREERRVRSAVAERHAEALRAADRHVGADLAGRRQHRQRQQIRRHRDQRARVVRALAQVPPVGKRAVRRRVLHQHAEHPLSAREVERRRVADAHLDPQRLGARAHDVDRLRMAGVGDQERPGAGGVVVVLQRRRQRVQHVHRLGRRGPFIQQRRVRDRQPRQVRHHRLVVDQRFQAPLRDLRLVGRVLPCTSPGSPGCCAG